MPEQTLTANGIEIRTSSSVAASKERLLPFSVGHRLGYHAVTGRQQS